MLLFNESKITLNLLKLLIQFSTFLKEGEEQPSSSNSVVVKKVLDELKIKPNWYNISKMKEQKKFPNPNEFFHLFVNNPD